MPSPISCQPDVQLLMIIVLFAYGNFEDLENHRAQNLFHFVSALRILSDRAKDSMQRKPSPIIDNFVEPMLTRLELFFSVFMVPLAGGEAIHCDIEPHEPMIPKQFTGIQEARKVFMAICCWRYRKEARTQPWLMGKATFEATRSKLLEWQNSLMSYATSPVASNTQEQTRIASLLSHFRLLFASMMYSARTILHYPEHLRPMAVEVLDPIMLCVSYILPHRWLHLLRNLDWASKPLEDLMRIRLWPYAEIVDTTVTSGLLRLTFRMNNTEAETGHRAIEPLNRKTMLHWYSEKLDRSKSVKRHLW